jgi:hypothetical protein
MHGTTRPHWATLALLAIFLAGCGDGSDGSDAANPPPPPATITLAGSGVKGPLAGAIVRVFAVNLAQPDIRGTNLDEGSTGANAAIQDIAIPASTTGLLRIDVIADADTIDLTTGSAPIFDSLTTVADASRLASNSVFASPLTTMAVDLAIRMGDSGAPYAGNGNNVLELGEFTTALAVAQNQVKSTLGFGLDDSIDIFTVPPLITNTTDTPAEQAAVAAYRQAIEALGAIAAAIAEGVAVSGGSATAQQIFDALTDDLTDGVINGQGETGPIEAMATLSEGDLIAIVTQDVTALTIPGSTVPVGAIEQLLADETGDTGVTTDTSGLENGSISVDPAPAEIEVDSDLDGVPDSEDAFPDDPTETVDSDSDGVGDNSDAFPLDPEETADSDSDGVGNNRDAFPNDPNETVDSDSDGVGDNGDAFPADPGETADADNDGVGDNGDAFPNNPDRSNPDMVWGNNDWSEADWQ